MILYAAGGQTACLLQHPLVESFLYLKWRRTRIIFFWMLFLYTLLVTGVTTYILAGIMPREDEALHVRPLPTAPFLSLEPNFSSTTNTLFVLILRASLPRNRIVSFRFILRNVFMKKKQDQSTK